MKGDIVPFTQRMKEPLLKKLDRIAFLSNRSRTAEINFIVENYIREYEKRNGEIKIN